MSNEERRDLGKKGRGHVLESYSMDKFAEKWDEILTKVHSDFGSWENRKDYKSWEFVELK